MRRPLSRSRGLGLALLVCALARVPALAQFSAPYDPDFAPSEERPAPAGQAAQPEAPAPVIILPTTGQFLLYERAPGAGFLETEVSSAPAPAEGAREFLQFEQSLKGLQYSEQKWNETRRHIEEGTEPTEGAITPLVAGGAEVEVSTYVPPKPPPPEVELPSYGTSLSITGRKVIGVDFSEKRFLYDQSTTGRPQTTNLININQQLQLRMQGKVGPKITVNVDYDDTKQNHQDISVVYTGDQNEVVQNVAFGDIDLSLPATEFVSYNKQLFGIRADVKYKGFKASFIGSRTKGTTKTKEFIGNTQFVATDILDTGYVRRTYYDVTFGNAARLPIKAASERVFLATQVPGQTNTNSVILTADDLAVPSSSFTGTFIQLIAGQDYTMDYVKGIITFRNQLQPLYVVAVDFVDASGNSLSNEISTGTTSTGGTGKFKLIKTPSDVPISTAAESGYNRELKTFYSIGQTQIVPDNGRGNFILKVLDQQRNEVGSALNPVQKYPDTITMDFANGLFQLRRPFAVVGDSSTVDPDIYAPTPISKRILHVEYSFRLKTFFLEPNLVPQSEVVILDNVKLNRNVDYFIDYDAGFITFFNENRILTNSTVDISYEVAPFAGITNDSLLGTRVSYDFNPHFSMGSTLLYESGTKSPTVPTITELSRSLLVYDFDSQLKDVSLGNKLKIKSLSGELAQSRQNLNLNAFALIDNMEGIKQEDAASTLSPQWFIASNPGGAPADPSAITWFSEDIKVLDINPRSQATSQETQKVLDVRYDFSVSTEVSIVFPFSAAGNDFSHKTLLEFVMFGDASSNELDFHLGSINEDADNNGGTTLNCADGTIRAGVPKTEDLNCDGILQPAEDIGWLYSPAGLGSKRFTASNGLIDTEDLNGNGRLDPQDFTGGDFGYVPDPNNPANNQLFDATSNSTRTVVDFGGSWHVFQVPLNISSQTIANWTNVRQVRLSVRKRAGGSNTGVLKFARIAVVGNTWQPAAAVNPATNVGPIAGESGIITPVNNIDNPGYVPIFNAGGDASQVFNDLYGSVSNLQKQSNTKNLSEQALQLQFVNMSSGAVVTTKRLFPRAIDISQHRYFNFLVYGNAQATAPNCADPSANCSDQTFFMRAGNDTNFFEVRVPLNFVGWKKIRVKQKDSANNSVADTWVADTPGTVVVSSGLPSLQQVSELVAGVQETGIGSSGAGITTPARVYINEIHLAEPITRVGTARKIEMNFEVPGWATFGGKYREIDRNFQTPTSVVSNQDNRSDNGYLNFSRLSFLPMSFNLSRTITDTPSTVQTGQLSNFVNLLQTGKVTTWNGTAQGNFSLGAYPRLGLNYARNRVDYDLLTRLDDRKTYNGTLQYGVPINSRFLPRTIDANYGLTKYDVLFRAREALAVAGNANTQETTNAFGLRMTFVPWTGSSFNPNYSLTRVRESRQDFTTGVELDSRYPKSQSQSAGFSSNYRLLSWLNPQVNYSIDILENNILNVSTFIVQGSTFVFNVGDIKTINRSGNGSISLPITISEIFPRTRLFKSMNIVNGYQLQDGDVWNNVERGLDSRTGLWVRTPFRPSNPAAVRQNLTLRDTFNSTQRWSPLDGYDIKGRLSALKTLSISNNYVKSIQRSDVTGTQSKTISTTLPDAVASISQLEKLWYAERWMSSTQMNFKYAAHKINTVGQTINTDYSFGTDLRTILIRRFDTLVSYNDRASVNRNLLVAENTQSTAHQDATVQTTFDIQKFRFTPKTDYTHDVSALGTGVKTQDLTVITPSLLVRADLALPRGLLLPGSTKTLLFTNRVIWTTTLSLAWRSSPVTVADNSKLLSLNTSADYELAKNLRMTLNGAASRLWHKFLKTEDFISYQFGTTLTFQF